MAIGKYKEWITPDGLLRLRGYARDGLTDKEITDKMGINVSTLYTWKNKYNEINEALKRGKEIPDRTAEEKIFSRVTGYQYEETKITVTEVVNPDTGNIIELKKTETYKKHMPPDVAAAIFWLKNRKPQVWRDKIDNGKDVTSELTKVDELLNGIDEIVRRKGGAD